jgi:4-hydroxy-3-polyprenylbenzoate decarboxylase
VKSVKLPLFFQTQPFSMPSAKSSARTSSALRIVVGISGASGVIYGVRALEVLKDAGVETHLVMSRSAEVTLAHETRLKVAAVKKLAHTVYDNANMAAAIASGSFRTMGMIVAPCSIRSVSEIATGVTSSLLTRAADVNLKERRRVVLMVRESPLHAGHLRTLTTAAEIGAVIAPPMPAFYAKPADLNEMIDHTVGRALDLFDIDALKDAGLVRRWGEGE